MLIGLENRKGKCGVEIENRELSHCDRCLQNWTMAEGLIWVRSAQWQKYSVFLPDRQEVRLSIYNCSEYTQKLLLSPLHEPL